MDSKFTEKLGYNGYPSPSQPPAWDQAPPPYGYPAQHPQSYQQQYPPQPQYPQSYTQQPQQQAQTNHPAMPAQNTPPQSYPRGLEVVFTSWTGRHMRVTEATHDGPLVYAADLKNRKPNMIFQAEGTAQLPATVIFHTFSRNIDINIDGKEMVMRSASSWRYEFGFDSIALGGKRLTWKNTSRWTWLNMECLDDSGAVYATFKAHKGWSGKKTGRLELQEACRAGGKGLVDEIVVTGLANVYIQIAQAVSSNSAAGAGAGVAAAVA
ncbi:hypothetical protein BDW59DRAFT_154853 [Aspergillus cavernicola]|uniref:Tubby C-terminal-like domain-containing protein n=1 Tax=Aspergillus cavernicola TaxID=176166 RepID=A0ABR4HD02_9EURO